VYDVIRQELAAGGRVYIVCPLVLSTAANAARGGGSSDSSSSGGGKGSSSAAGGGEAQDCKGAAGDPRRTVMDEYARLSRANVFGAEHRVGLLHGRMSGDEKARALQQFSRWVGEGGRDRGPAAA
jgi:RecG-like helicase